VWDRRKVTEELPMRHQNHSTSFVLVALLFQLVPEESFGQQIASDPLPYWNDGPAKRAIVEFVRVTTDKSSPKYFAPEERIAVFDQDGTLWVEHPMYSQLMYCLDRVLVLAAAKPEFKGIGCRAAPCALL
jgi:hypothetical protein